VIDFSRAGGEPIPGGTYNAKVTECTFVPATSSGNLGVKFVYTIDDEDVPEFEGRKVAETKSLQSQAIWSVKERFVALGIDPDRMTGEMTVDDFNDICGECLGAECRIKLSTRHYVDRNGVDREGNQVDMVLASLAGIL
jgi:hypothetical protein